MHTITLICTKHVEGGICTTNFLLAIIESIGPDVIFEEISEDISLRIYNERSLLTLESSAIKEYRRYNPIRHIPVDTYEFPNSHYADLDFMNGRILNAVKKESWIFKATVNQHLSSADRYGFRYLNSNGCDILTEHIENLKDEALAALNDERLFKIRQQELEVNSKREDQILRNVYDYSKKNAYEHGILFIGAGHRRAIIEKIEKHIEQEDLKLNWIIYSE